MLCDSAGSPSEEAGRSTYDKETEPRKHPAVEGEGDVAFVCNICHMVTCKNCVEVTPTDSTPVSPSFPFTEGTNLPTGSKDIDSLSASKDTDSLSASKDTDSLSASKDTDSPSASKDTDSPSASKDTDSPSASNSKESTNPTLSKSSLLDDFADPSTELPDYTGNDD
jgi:hypothetical protein